MREVVAAQQLSLSRTPDATTQVEKIGLDRDGRPTRDGEAAFEGIMLPFGEHKGAAMSWMMDVMAGVFTGALFGGAVANPFTELDRPQRVGHTFVSIRADLFMPMTAFVERMGDMDDRVKALLKAAGFNEILAPGEPEARIRARNLELGVPLSADVVRGLAVEAERAGIPAIA